MSTRLSCPHGHAWDLSDGELATSDSLEVPCPVCGAFGQFDPLQGFGAEQLDTDDELPPPPHPTPLVVGKVFGELLSPPAARAKPAAPDQPAIAGYEILSKLGRGGMGVVYKACQVRLGRSVALKMVLTGAHAEPEELARFRSEAEAVARIQHPNIVQIYEVGEQDGYAYFSMEFVDGGNLAQKLAGRPLSPRVAAQLARTLAQAVHYAHQKGIVHRDLKPANILLAQKPEVRSQKQEIRDQKSDISQHESEVKAGVRSTSDLGSLISDLTPKITDFGLAKRMEAEVGQTKTGQIVGTPGYMAPEQADGHVGPASDIYSLGAILYEMLTGRPPFQGPTALDTLRQSQSEEPVSPSRLQRSVPGDLETICLKCLQNQPLKRYTDAEALADELQRFLAGEPIHARPVGLLERGVKWTKRKPTVAALVLGSLLVAAGLVTMLLWHNAELRAQAIRETQHAREVEAQRDTANKLRVEENKQRQRAEANFLKARHAAEQLTEVATKHLAAAPRMEQLRRDLLVEVLKIYQGFLEEKSTDPVIRNETARAHARAGAIHRLLEQHSQAEDAFRQAISLFDDLPDEFRNNVYWRELGHTHSELSVLLADLGRHDEAERAANQAIDVFDRLVADSPDPPQHRQDQALGYIRLASVLQNGNRKEEAEQVLRKGLAFQQALVATCPGEPSYLAQLATAQNNLGMLLENKQELRDAEGHFREALEHYKELHEKSPNNTFYAQNLANASMSLGRLLRRDRRFEEAESSFRQAINLLENLARDHPSVSEYRSQLGGCYGSLAYLLISTKRAAEAEEAWRLALDLKQRVVTESPNVPDYRSSLAAVQNDLAMLLTNRGELAQARQLLEEAIGHQKAALELDARNAGYRRFLRNHHGALAETLLRQGEHARAAETARELPRIFADSWQDHLGAAGFLARASTLAANDHTLADSQRQAIAQSYADQAMESLTEAVNRGFKDVRYLDKSDFNSLRSRDDFTKLLNEMGQETNSRCD